LWVDSKRHELHFDATPIVGVCRAFLYPNDIAKHWRPLDKIDRLAIAIERNLTIWHPLGNTHGLRQHFEPKFQRSHE
jgi:hypothetical protein